MEFWSQYVFRSFSYYPEEIIAKHITLKEVYTEVLSAKVVIESTKQFPEAADRLCDIKVMYLDAKDIKSPDLTESIYTRGTLKIDLYLNSTFNKLSDVFKSSSWDEKNGE